LLSVGAELFVFRFAIQKYKDRNVRISELLVVLYGLRTLREERRLRVLENRVLRGIFVAKGIEGTGEW